MRAVLVCLLFAIAALPGCKSEPSNAAGKTPDPTGGGDGDEGDQALFDRDRQPEMIIRALGLAPGKYVADIGAGTGLLTVHVARAVTPGGKVVATDIDGAVLEYLKARMVAAGFDHVVEGRVVQPTEPGLEPGRYDAILLAQVDHYFDDRTAWLKKAAPALKPGGKLAIANRAHHRAAAIAAAEAAGYTLVTEVADIPGQFVAVFEVKEGTP
ncbi:MAG: class I SAM-dependent methyltransferase [Kofleriaceae bacterium]|nr:MAG: class I SAM-dependent methyltransferase [Kofleriaceae bacterium]MBZ0235249.1 class I SAM-dependent methyltransferase [Kofleriaceae bacterium]